MAVITISRQFGSGGNEIAQKIYEIAQYAILDKNLLVDIASEAGLGDQEIIDYSEENTKIKNFIDRLLGRSRPVPQLQVWKEDTGSSRLAAAVSLDETKAVSLTRNAIILAYKRGQFVILGMGGQSLLKKMPGVLHVRVEAPLEARIARVAASPLIANRQFRTQDEARTAAKSLIESEDNISKEYLKRYYKVRGSKPAQYHMLINTGLLEIDLAAEILVQAAQVIDRAMLAAGKNA